MKRFFTLVLLGGSMALASTGKISERLRGDWMLVGLTCNGKPQALDMDYSLSFNGGKGAYVSKTKACTQVEPELYGYPSEGKLSIKSGVRACAPSPCAADLPANRCGRETNAKVVQFEVKFDRGGKMVLSTSDPASVDCIGAGQEKPAVFTFVKK